MNDSPKNTYMLKSGYDSPYLLIEFKPLEDSEYFLFEIIHMLGLAGFESPEMLNLWMNDKIVVNLTSPNGTVTVSLDVEGILRITGNENQADITRIDKLLQLSKAFLKEEVGSRKYKIE